jgi:solute carrier family 25 protein 39/40
VANEGAHNLWRGLSPTLMMAVPATIVYFVGYEALRSRLAAVLPDAAAPLVAGAGARAIAASLISPLELVRTNMQHLGADGTARAVLGQVVRACRTQGTAVLFKGLVPTLWRDVPFSALYWSSFERTRAALRPYLGTRGRPSTEFGLSFVAGAVSGALAAAATTPFDVAKTRTQIQLGQSAGTRASMLAQLRAIWQSEGTAGLFRGLSPRVCKVAPACAIMIGSYEFCKAFFVQSKQHK